MDSSEVKRCRGNPKYPIIARKVFLSNKILKRILSGADDLILIRPSKDILMNIIKL